jgi:hypothetical protein
MENFSAISSYYGGAAKFYFNYCRIGAISNLLTMQFTAI